VKRGVEPGTIFDPEESKPKSLLQWDGLLAASRSHGGICEDVLVLCESKLHVRAAHVRELVARKHTMDNYMSYVRSGVKVANSSAQAQAEMLLTYAGHKLVYAIGGPLHDADVEAEALKHGIIFVDWTTPPCKVHGLQHAIDAASGSSSDDG
jgi:hypothetical protein